MSLPSNSSDLELLASSLESQSELDEFLDSLTDAQALELLYDWEINGRKNQLVPEGSWAYWLILAGRGFGKTRTGAETIRKWVNEGYDIIHLVGATAADARDVMIQGESGLVNCFPPHQRPLYEPSKRLVTFHNGAVAHVFSADEPERLRGPQCKAFWCDEIAAWRFGQDAWDNLLFGFRLGNDPRGVITTTPKPIKLLKDIIADKNTVVTRGSSYQNKSNLAPAFFNAIVKKYEGTRLGRQELEAEILDDTPGALWTWGLIEASRWATFPSDEVVRIVVAIDPAVSQSETSADTGIVVAAFLRNAHVVVLDDLTCHESPLGWAKVAIAAYLSRRADRIVGEVNNGGDLVESNIRAVNPNVSFRSVRASRGKSVRAEPVAALYEQGRVHHLGTFAALETQMCSFVPGSPRSADERLDRMDALVWAITELVVDVEVQQTTRPWEGSRRVSISRF